jgi:hypothetical protein
LVDSPRASAPGNGGGGFDLIKASEGHIDMRALRHRSRPLLSRAALGNATVSARGRWSVATVLLIGAIALTASTTAATRIAARNTLTASLNGAGPPATGGGAASYGLRHPGDATGDSAALAPSPPPAAPPALATTTVAVDGVPLDLTTPILPGGELASTTPGDAYQVASAISYAPYRALEVAAIPYGFRNASLTAVLAIPGAAQAVRDEIAATRTAETLTWQQPVAATIFGSPVTGLATQASELVGGVPTSRLRAEWVAEAGNRVWIVRITADSVVDDDRAALATLLAKVAMSSSGLANPTTVADTASTGVPIRSTDNSFTLGLPPWWAGQECDAGHNPAHTLLASWNGLDACGPNTDVLSLTSSDTLLPSWGHQLEWECVELSKRYLWLRYGVPDPPADGDNTVDAEAPRAPMLTRYWPDGMHVPRAGDVISFGTSSPGHTAVVMSSTVDSNGNGTYTTLNENTGANAIITFDIVHWVVSTTYLGRATGIPPVNDWLHDPKSTPGILGPGGLGRLPAGGAAGTPSPPGQPAGAPPSSGVAAAGAAPPATPPGGATPTSAPAGTITQGSFVRTPDGAVYVVAGGAALRVSACDGLPSACTSPTAIPDLTAFHAFPTDGTLIAGGGSVWKIAGGAPMRLGACPATAECTFAIPIDATAVTHLDHLLARPADGTLLRVPGALGYRVAGGAPLAVGDCGTCKGAVDVPLAVVTALDHLDAVPSDGTLIDVGATIWRIAGGAPLRLSDCPAVGGCSGSVAVTQNTIDSLDHMRALPADGTFLITAGPVFYRVAGGEPFQVDDCASIGGCAGAVGVSTSTVTSHDHMRAVAADGTLVVAKPSNAVWRITGGQRSPASGAGIALPDATVAAIPAAPWSPTPTPTPSPKPTN